MRPNMDMHDDPGERSGKIVDLLSRANVTGRATGVHHLMSVLAKSDKGPMPHLANVMLILAHDPPLAGMLGFNEFTHEALLMRSPPPPEDGGELSPGPYPRPWGSEDASLVQAYLQRVWCHKIVRQTTEDAMLTEAGRRRFHPVRDWLAGLKYDGRSRLDKWLFKAFGTPDDDYHRTTGAKFLIAAVRRIRKPGCKFDQMPVLEGPQGIGKSRGIEALFSRDLYSDDMPPNLSDKDAAMALHGVWGMEFGEIDHLIRNEVEVIKAFLSRSVDRFRPPYGKFFIERPRQTILIGSTNQSDYLRDHTGNRRFWPIRCQFSDVEWIAAHRDQLWAEAAAREASGEVLWLDDKDVAATASQEQSDRMQEDVWSDRISLWLVGHTQVKAGQLLTDCLSIPAAQQDKRSQMRCASILTQLGWERTTRRTGQRTEKVWLPKSQDGGGNMPEGGNA